MPTAISADGMRHTFPDGTDQAVIDRVMKEYAQSKQPATESYTGEILPFRRDDSGLHLAVPGIISGLFGGAQSMGQRALGVGEQGKQPLRPLTPTEIGTVMALSPATVARGTGRLIGTERSAPGLSPAQARLADFQGQGVTPNIPAVSQGRASGLMAKASEYLPYSPVGAGIQKNIGETAAATTQAAERLGTPQDVYGAGSVASNALKRFASNKADSRQDYDKFFGLMQGAKEAPIPNTLQALGQMKLAYPNAPELTDVFTSPPILRMANALEPRQVNIPARTSPMLDPYGRPIVTSPAQIVQRGGKLTIDEIKNMRTQIGEKLENPTIGPDSVPRGQLKQLYGALTRDMYAMARTHSPAAERALNEASQQYRLRMGIIDRLDRLTNKDAPESVFYDINRAASEGSGQDTKLLSTIKKVLTPEEWGDVGASIVQRLGNPRPGQMPAPGQPAFSVNTLATNWNKLTPRAKELLFGPNTPGSPRAGLEQLSRVAASLQNVSKLANTSHTYENRAALGIVTELLGNLSIGRIPIPELAGLGGAYGVSKLLMSPGFTRWIYKLPATINSSPPMMAPSLALRALAADLVSRKERQQKEQPGTARTVPPLSPSASPMPIEPISPAPPAEPPRVSLPGP